VAYSVEEQKATKESTCDELKIAIATDGSITPIEAISLAAKILVEHLNVFVDLGSIASGLQVMSAIEQASSPSVASISTLSTPITDLNLTTRSYNCLVRQGIKTVQEILNMNREQIASIKNLGKKSLYEIMKVLKTRGYEIKKT
jgi:DNA-directed RNA polymerase subunit alpha